MYDKSLQLILWFLLFSNSIKSQIFDNVASLQGIHHSLNSTDNWGSGVSFFDFNDDGWDDLTLLLENDSILFYKNNQGSFELLPSFIFNQGETKQVLWVDYDNDNDYDLLVTTKFAPERLYNNDGSFNFTDVSQQAGLYGIPAVTLGASFGDLNNDGFLDLYLCRYMEIGDTNDISHINLLFMNNGDGTFTDKTVATEIGNHIAPSFQAVWLDYDKDGWQDIYVINDKPLDANYLYKNNGNGTFTDMADSAGAGLMLNDPMSNTVGDFDNDADLDIYMSNIGNITTEGKLLVNNNNGTFNEMGLQFGVGVTEWSWGSTWIDYDNDSYQDLYVTTALVGNSIFPEVSCVFYKSNQAQIFNDYTSLAFNGNHIAASYAVAKGDINNDGYADMIVQNAKNYESFLWQNSGGINRYIKVSLKGTISNKMAIGSWIHVYAGGAHYTQYTLCGENYLSQSSQQNIIGLAQQTVVDSIHIVYLSGIVDKYYNLAVDQHYYFVEGETALNQISFSGSLNFCSGDSVVLNAGNFQSYLWSNGSQQSTITVTQSGSYSVLATASNGLIYMSDTVIVQVSQPPSLSLSVTHITCHNNNDGVVILHTTNYPNNASITWSNGSIGDSLFNLAPGTYSYLFTDSMGCTYTDSILVIEPYPLNVQTAIIPCYNECDGAFQLIINGGTPPYNTFIDSINVGAALDSLNFGFYTIDVYDSSNCHIQLTIEIPDSTQTSLNEISYQFNVFPNPLIGNVLNIQTNQIITQIEAYDSEGKLIPTSYNNQQLHLNSEIHGMIYLRVQSGEKLYWLNVLRM